MRDGLIPAPYIYGTQPLLDLTSRAAFLYLVQYPQATGPQVAQVSVWDTNLGLLAVFENILVQYPSRWNSDLQRLAAVELHILLNGNLVSEDQKLQLVHNSATSLSKLYCSTALSLELNLLFVLELVGLLLLIIQSQIWELFWWWKIVWPAAAFEVFICRVKVAS